MPAIARKFHGSAGIVAVIAAIFLAFFNETFARGMGALILGFLGSHRPPLSFVLGRTLTREQVDWQAINLPSRPP
jgi:hypothetical protein